MAVTITPLGFKKPDGQELANTGENVISANAQTAEDLIAADRGRLGAAESTAATQGNRLTAAESSLTNVRGRLSYVEAAVAAGGTGGGTGGGSTLTPDPDNAGLYFIV